MAVGARAGIESRDPNSLSSHSDASPPIEEGMRRRPAINHCARCGAPRSEDNDFATDRHAPSQAGIRKPSSHSHIAPCGVNRDAAGWNRCNRASHADCKRAKRKSQPCGPSLLLGSICECSCAPTSETTLRCRQTQCRKAGVQPPLACRTCPANHMNSLPRTCRSCAIRAVRRKLPPQDWKASPATAPSGSPDQ